MHSPFKVLEKKHLRVAAWVDKKGMVNLALKEVKPRPPVHVLNVHDKKCAFEGCPTEVQIGWTCPDHNPKSPYYDVEADIIRDIIQTDRMAIIEGNLIAEDSMKPIAKYGRPDWALPSLVI